MAVSVRLPALLGADLHEVARLTPTLLSVDLSNDLEGGAELTMPKSATPLRMHDWVSLYTAAGFAGIYRVTDISDKVDRHTVRYTLRHAIDTLSDSVWPTAEDYDGTVADFLGKILSHQTAARWQLGTCADPGDWKKKGINYDRLSELLGDLIEERLLEGYGLTFDFTTTPWTVNLVQLETAPSFGLRLSRNLSGVQIDRSDKDLCTRLYLSVSTKSKRTITPAKPAGPTPASNTVTVTTTGVRIYDSAAAQARYGIVEKTADIDAEDVPDPDDWADTYLRERAEPRVQIEVDGILLEQQTGDTWDGCSVGRLGRVDLPEYGETYTERAVSVSYPDVLGKPRMIKVALANKLPKVSESIKAAQKAARKAGGAARSAGRGGASAADMTHWAQVVSDSVAALDGTGLSQLWQSGIELDAQEGVTIYSLNQGFQSQYAQIKVNSGAITAEAARAADAEGQLSARITVNADAITTKVAKGEISSTINQTAQSVLIQASKIDLDGYVTVSDLSATNAQITNLISGSTIATNLKARTLSGIDTVYLYGVQCSWKSQYVITSASVTLPTITRSSGHYFMYGSSSSSQSPSGSVNGYIITNSSTGSVSISGKTIYYLGYIE